MARVTLGLTVGILLLASSAAAGTRGSDFPVSIRVCGEGIHRLSVDRSGIVEYRMVFSDDRDYSKLTATQLEQLNALVRNVLEQGSVTEHSKEAAEPFMCDRYLLRVSVGDKYHDFEKGAELTRPIRELVAYLEELAAMHFGRTAAEHVQIVTTGYPEPE